MLTISTGTSMRVPSSIALAIARATRSRPPPGGVPATIRTGRSGFQACDAPFILGQTSLKVPQDRRPKRDFGFVKGVEVSRAALLRGHHVIAEVGEAFDHDGIVQRDTKRPIEPLDDRRWCALRCREAEPNRQIEIRHAGFGGCWHVRQHW